MDWIQALILGIVQGLTEFLPVSSSGHLVMAQHILGVNEPGVLLEVILHIGSLTAILLYFFQDLKQLLVNFINGDQDARKYVTHLTIATLPAVCIGILFKDIIELTFTLSVVKWMFIVTGMIVGSTYFYNKIPKRKMALIFALCIGIAQSFALLPGISRSGITISVAIIIGIQHKEAAKFAFFMAIPVLIGAGLIQIHSIGQQVNNLTVPLMIGFVSSSITGYLVISWLLDFISKGNFYWFSFYCFAVALLAFIL